MKQTSTFTKLIFAGCLLLGIFAVSVMTFLQSNRISQRIRQAVIDGVEDATGARVEIPSCVWNWRTLTVEMRGFTMRGFEPPSGPPLFTSPVIRARLRILSLLDRNVQLSSLVVTRPRFYLMIEPDGKTNIPGPRHIISPRQIINTLIDLRLPHVRQSKDGRKSILVLSRSVWSAITSRFLSNFKGQFAITSWRCALQLCASAAIGQLTLMVRWMQAANSGVIISR